MTTILIKFCVLMYYWIENYSESKNRYNESTVIPYINENPSSC